MSTDEHDAAATTRTAWDEASRKHDREYAELLASARSWELLPAELEALRELVPGAEILHPMSGHGLDDHALARLGARSVLGLDFAEVARASAQRRADELRAPLSYELAQLPESGQGDASVDGVYTGKGALIWLADLDAFLREMRRVLRPGGWLFVYEAHPLVPVWSWDADEIRARRDRSYFARTHVNDTFPAGGAVEHQRTLAEHVTAVLDAGFTIRRLAEHPEPFWRPDGVDAAAWDGRVPNAFSLLAVR